MLIKSPFILFHLPYLPFSRFVPSLFWLSSLTLLYCIFYPCCLLQVNSMPFFVKDIFSITSFHFVFSIFLPSFSIFFITLPLTHHSLLSRTQASEREKKIIWILWITLLFLSSLFLSSCSRPPSYSQRYLSADFPHACQGWTALGNSR